jgi:hypothetical protein
LQINNLGRGTATPGTGMPVCIPFSINQEPGRGFSQKKRNPVIFAKKAFIDAYVDKKQRIQ